MAARDIALMKGNVMQSALLSTIAGAFVFVFQPSAMSFSRLGSSIFVGCGKRVVNGIAIYACCSMLDAARRGGVNFWFLNNKIGSPASADEYFMSSSFRFMTFAASSGASCITNFCTRLIGLYGSRKGTPVEEAPVAVAEGDESGVVAKAVSGGAVVRYLSAIAQFYDTEQTLRSYTNLARLIVHSSLFGIGTVLTGAGLLPVTLGPIDNATHIRVLRSCGPAELAYWSTVVSLSTVAAETVWNSLFFVSTIGEKLMVDGSEPDRSLGFTIVAGAIIGIAGAALNGACVFVISNRAVAVLGEESSEAEAAERSGALHSACRWVHTKAFSRVLDPRKGVAYIWARCISQISHTLMT